MDELSINDFLAVVDEFNLRGSGRSRDTFLFASAIQHGVLMLTADRALQRKCERVVGVAPLARDSGKMHQPRMCWGGRKALRQALWMPTITATRFNPALRGVP